MVPTKILYVITLSSWGGAQKYVFDLATKLNKKKFKIEVAVGEGKETNWIKNLKKQNIKVWRLKYVVRELKPIYDFLSGWELYFLYKKSQPQIIHLNSSKVGSTGAVAAWIYKKLNRKKVKIIYTVHGLVLNEPLSLWKKIYYLVSEKISAWCKDKIICVSEFDRKAILKFKIAPAKKITLIYNGIQINNLATTKPSIARQKLIEQLTVKLKIFNINRLISNNDYIIGTIANLYPTKGLPYLIQAIHLLSTPVSKKWLKLIIIGDGPQRNYLINLIHNYQLESNIFLVGSLETASNYLKAFNLFILPSIKEGLSYSLIEALAADIPIIATKVGGNPEIIKDKQNGLLVEPASADLLAEAVKQILQTPQINQSFKRQNSEKIKKFNINNMLKKTQQIYS